jgi:hypothetical protein
MTAGREVFLEFQRLGNAVKVTATDSETLVEVSIQGPAHSGDAELRRAAIDKLNYVLRRRAAAGLTRGKP